MAAGEATPAKVIQKNSFTIIVKEAEKSNDVSHQNSIVVQIKG